MKEMFGSSKDNGRLKKLYYDNFRNLDFSRKFLRAIQYRRVRLASHVTCIGEKNAYIILAGKMQGRISLRRHRIILKESQ